MSSKASVGLIIAGAVMMALGICCVPAALSDRSDSDTLAMGACLFGAGALIAALGIYFKARRLKAAPVAVEAPSEANAKRKLRAACDLCGTEAPVVLCTVHQVHVCGTCLVQHFDRRSCAYIPSARAAAAGKNAKAVAKATGA